MDNWYPTEEDIDNMALEYFNRLLQLYVSNGMPYAVAYSTAKQEVYGADWYL